ncbi:Polyketide cyclase / dehydrase and lipid transport [Salinihabitans flavidus]|uniref:Polyketide cyclase / dehydrase and lipid transport n=1 Tax=Salinihabitans flavidus TaxID=569882 RepID=A0A1H8V520_9RHOB|nr:SRPBCC family protein [Salinihabitans flavidus]SEP10327.1 Polyketide cyclase / dehydrase and lipid transport [Salinihabitans flavidus]
MNITAREDIEAPIEHVFEMLSDFTQHERAALRRGAEVDRLDSLTEPGPGMAWDMRFRMRGKNRQVRLELVRYDPPFEMAFAAHSPNIEADLVLDLVALSKARTRLNLALDLKPRTLSARLFIQSMKLARGSVSKRLEKGLAAQAREWEDRYARPA